MSSIYQNVQYFIRSKSCVLNFATVMGISTTLEEAADAARVARTDAVRPDARRGGGALMKNGSQLYWSRFR